MQKKILIIDDEPDVLKVLIYRLKAKGYDILTATNGNDGIKAASEEKPNLVLLDYRLPDLSAEEVAEKIKYGTSGKVPIILITASSDRIEDKAKECGAADFIAKPIDPQELYTKIDKQLQVSY